MSRSNKRHRGAKRSPAGERVNDLAAAARLVLVGLELVVVIVRDHLGGGGLGGLL
jgi:hypothetical protein